MMSPVIAIPVILLMSSIVSTDAYDVISKIPNVLNKQNSQVDAKNTSKGDFNNTQTEATANDFETIGEDSMVGLNIARKDLIRDDDRSTWNQLTNSQANAINTAANKERSDARIEAIANDFQAFGEDSKIGVDIPKKDSNLDYDRPKWNQPTNAHADAKITAALQDKLSDAQIETIAKDVETFGEDIAKFDTYIAKNSNLGDDKEIEIPNWISRVKRDLEYVWDNCPDKTSLQFVDNVLKCHPDNDQEGLGDRVFEPLQNGSCPAGQRRVQLGRVTVCIEDRRRRKNG